MVFTSAVAWLATAEMSVCPSVCLSHSRNCIKKNKASVMIGIWLESPDKVQKFWGLSPKKYWGQKHAKFRSIFLQRPTLIANISGTA